MALLAINGGVAAGQREARRRVVIERRSRPIRCRVAAFASGREAGLGVIRVRRPVEILRMATEALRRQTLEQAADVTLRAICLNVGAGQGEARQRIMIETCVLPLIDRVARLALERYACRRVVEAPSACIVLLMAGDAFRAEPCVGSGRGPWVTRCALHRRMRAHQREAIAMLADLANGLLPTLHRVAVLATRAKLIAMDIGVAVRALDADILEHQASVAIVATHVLVHPAKRVRSLGVVVELGYSANRTPTARRVAVLARHF